jgi:cell division protein FtsQ
MSIKDNIKKLVVVVFWTITGAGALILLVAAINRRNSKTCKKYEVRITGGGGHVFMNSQEVIRQLLPVAGDKLTGRTIVSYDLHAMEERLKSNPWIRDAQLFFDNNEVLRIRVALREPIARIFTKTGGSFFLDSSAAALPLRDMQAVKLPVFTNFPGSTASLHGPDSAITQQTRKLAWYILCDSFWKAEIEQVAITPSRGFELVPVIGNHIVEFGDATEAAAKFHRLLIFYQDVLSKAGFDKYAVVDVRFAGQVVGTRTGSNMSKADSLQAVRNIRSLIESAQKAQADTVLQRNTRPLEQNTLTEQTLGSYDIAPVDVDSAAGRRPASGHGKKH